MHQLDRVARSYRHVAELWAAHDRAVVLDNHDARIELQRAEQLEQGSASRHRAPLAVHRDLDRVVHPGSSCSMRRTAPAGSVASHKARIAAAPYAPAARSPGIRSGVTPPMAMTGSPSGRCVRGGCDPGLVDRKSTRLNSSHGYISYAVFCLQ